MQFISTERKTLSMKCDKLSGSELFTDRVQILFWDVFRFCDICQLSCQKKKETDVQLKDGCSWAQISLWNLKGWISAVQCHQILWNNPKQPYKTEGLCRPALSLQILSQRASTNRKHVTSLREDLFLCVWTGRKFSDNLKKKSASWLRLMIQRRS